MRAKEIALLRKQMIERHLIERGIHDPRVLDAMREVPREFFVDTDLRKFAYDDSPLPIAEGQTISQPYVVALMTEAAALKATDRVLEIGTGSGYAAAILSRIACHVDTIERHVPLAALARHTLQKLGYANIDVHMGDGTEGWPGAAPYDAMLVTAGGPGIPACLREQLAIGGRLIMPVGDRPWKQRLIRLTRRSADGYDQEDLGEVMFVPLVGRHGWGEDVTRIDDEPT